MSDEKKILVTIDGSKRSKRTIDYICSFKPFRDRNITLLNITTPVPEAYYDLTRDAFSNISVGQVKAWEMGQRTIITEFLKEARQRMIAAGYKPDNIEIKIVDQSRGIARGILDELKSNEYQSLVIRRKGRENSILSLAMGGGGGQTGGKSGLYSLDHCRDP